MEPTPKKGLGGYKAKPKRKHYKRVKPLALAAPLINPAFTTPAPTYTVTTDGPVNLGSPLPLATWTVPLSSGLGLQFQLQLSAQVVPSSTTQADNQITIRADAAQAIANWILENWEAVLPQFVKVFPHEFKRVLGVPRRAVAAHG